MKRKSLYRQEESMELQMTPMIDVIFQLLIFFICTSTFQQLEELLPTPVAHAFGNAESMEPVEIPPEILDLGEIVILIHYDGGPYWDVSGTRYRKLEEIRALLLAVAENSTEMPVILNIDENVPLENVLDVYDLAREARFVRIQFAVPKET
ncbi:MAG: biopolymer transporter ExbD [Planctomycetia bacterium]|nr:biopolymer transporter ExbD [Planctomycetia bacterium]